MEAPANRDLLWLASMLGSIEPQCKAERVRHRTDTVFLLTMGGRVIAMQTGFATMEAAYGRPSNSANIMMKNSMDLFLGIFVYYFAGFLITFGDPPLIIEENGFDFALWFLHFSYATTAATINSGALAGRVSFLAYVVLSSFLTGVVYPVAAEWVWGGGWLGNLGYIDFAGSSVVHLVGAISALVAVAVCGPRIGKYPSYRAWRGIWKYIFLERYESSWYRIPSEPVEKAVFTPIKACNNYVQLLFGTFLLVVGFLAFNPGAIMAATSNSDLVSARATVTTLIAAAAGAVSAVVWSIAAKRGLRLRVPEMTNSVLGGVVASCAGCNVIPPLPMMLVGFVGGLLATSTARLMERLQLDDTVGAVSVHGPPAIWGTLAVAFFARPHCQNLALRGLFFGGGEAAWKLLLTQGCGLASLGALAAISTYVCVTLLDLTIGFRCNRAFELIGLDFTEHGYDDGKMPQYKVDHVLAHSPVRDCLVERVKSRLSSTPSSPSRRDSSQHGGERGEADADAVSTPAASVAGVGDGRARDPQAQSLQQELADLRKTLDSLNKAAGSLVNAMRGEEESHMGLRIIGAEVYGGSHGQNRQQALEELMCEAESHAALRAAQAHHR